MNIQKLEDESIYLSHETLIRHLLEKFDLTHIKLVKIPMATIIKLRKNTGESLYID